MRNQIELKQNGKIVFQHNYDCPLCDRKNALLQKALVKMEYMWANMAKTKQDMDEFMAFKQMIEEEVGSI